LTLLLSCSHAPSAPPDLAPPADFAHPPFCTDGADGGPAPTFANVQLIFTNNCAFQGGCHDPTGPGQDAVAMTQDLRAGHAYAAIVNVPSTEMCGLRVSPGNPDQSFLYRKISQAAPCASGCNPFPAHCSQMPLGETPIPLRDCEQKVIHDWISDGAMP